MPRHGVPWSKTKFAIFAAFIQTQYSVSHFHSHAAFTKQEHPLSCDLGMFPFFKHYLNYPTGTFWCFLMQALNLFIPIRCYFMFPAMMSHAMP